MAEGQAEAARLEELWSGDFGDDYVDRNRTAYDKRATFWSGLLPDLKLERVLEVGCNLGGNLRFVVDHVDPRGVHGLDVNRKALATLRQEAPEINAQFGSARQLPYRDEWFDLVYTMGVLIHQPDSTLPLVMAEMVRCSRKYVLCGEYFGQANEAVPYRGHEGALFRRDYGGLFGELFPELELAKTGFLSKDEGWDDITWWLFAKR